MYDQILEEETVKTLKCLKTNKTAGPDGIENIILKILAEALAKPLSSHYNILEKGEIPLQWYESGIILFKKGNHLDIHNYRPTNLSQTQNKVFSKI